MLTIVGYHSAAHIRPILMISVDVPFTCSWPPARKPVANYRKLHDQYLLSGDYFPGPLGIYPVCLHCSVSYLFQDVLVLAIGAS